MVKSGWHRLGEAIAGVEMACPRRLCDRWGFLAAIYRSCWQQIGTRVDWVVVVVLLSSTCLVAVIASVRPASFLVLPGQNLSVQLHLPRRRTPVGPVSVRSSSMAQLRCWRQRTARIGMFFEERDSAWDLSTGAMHTKTDSSGDGATVDRKETRLQTAVSQCIDLRQGVVDNRGRFQIVR